MRETMFARLAPAMALVLAAVGCGRNDAVRFGNPPATIDQGTFGFAQIVRDLPSPVEAIVLRCMEKRPEKRFPSMQALIAALDDEIRGARRAIHFENVLLRYRRKIFGGKS